MKKLICILTVTALLFTTSVSSFAAAVPNTACETDIVSETVDTGSSSGQQLRFDLKSFLNELIAMFNRLLGQEAAQPAKTDAQPVNKPTVVKVPAADNASAKPANTPADKNTNSCPLGNTCPTAVSGSCGKSTCPNAGACPNGTCPKGACSNGTCSNGTCPKGACSNGTCPKGACLNGTCSGGTCGSKNNCTNNTAPAKAQTGNNSKPASAGNKTEVPAQAPVKTPVKAPVKVPVKTPVNTETANGKDTVKAPAPSADTANLSYEQKVVALVNDQRAANGLKPLTLNEKLSDVARAKSQDMHDKKYFSHTSPTYGSPFDMMKTFGISYRAAGENIAMGYATPEAVVDGWMNSPGHRANILNASFTQIGVGYVSSGNYWTQMFIG